MAISTRLSRQAGRKFAFTLGPALLVFALIGWYFGHSLTMTVLGGIGIALIAAGALVPAHLGPIERAWMKLGEVMSGVMTPVTMGFVYFLVITPIGAMMRAIGRNALSASASRSAETAWVVREKRQSDLERQF